MFLKNENVNDSVLLKMVKDKIKEDICVPLKFFCLYSDLGKINEVMICRNIGLPFLSLSKASLNNSSEIEMTIRTNDSRQKPVIKSYSETIDIINRELSKKNVSPKSMIN